MISAAVGGAYAGAVVENDRGLLLVTRLRLINIINSAIITNITTAVPMINEYI